MMNHSIALPRSLKIIRWTARIWSIVVTTLCLLIFFGEGSGPSPIIPVDIPPVEMFLLSLTGVALLGLFVAWRWELVGGILTIAMMFIRELAWVILKGHWLVSFLILWVAIAPPAILFLIASRLGRQLQKNSVNTAG